MFEMFFSYLLIFSYFININLLNCLYHWQNAQWFINHFVMSYACKREQTDVPLSSIIAGLNCLEDQGFLVFLVMCKLHLFGKNRRTYMYVYMYVSSAWEYIESKSHRIDQINNYTIQNQQLK